LAKFFLSILIYEFSPFTYTLVYYKNVETLFTDSVRNVVITKSPDKDMIVADHINQVNLSCEAEGNPSVDCFDDGIPLTIYNIIDSTRIDATLICRKVIDHQKMFS
jgi:hypothetical protein